MHGTMDLSAALAQVKGARQKAWLEALTSEAGLHPTDGRSRYGSVTADRIERFLGCLYAVGYSIEKYALPPQRTPRWHLTGWESASAETRGASKVLCDALHRAVTPRAIDSFDSELSSAGFPSALELVQVDGLLRLVRVLVRDSPGTHWPELLKAAWLTLR